MEVKTDWYLKD